MARELGQYQYCAPDDGMWHRNRRRGHEREIVAACDPKRSIRPFAEPPNEAVGFGVTCTWRTCRQAFGRRRSRTPRSLSRAGSGMTASLKMALDDGFVAYTWRLFWLKP